MHNSIFFQYVSIIPVSFQYLSVSEFFIGLDIDQYIYKNLHQAQQNNFKVIIMGDFNVDPDKLDHLILLNKKIHWKYKLIQHLRGLNFVDSYATFHDDQGGT